MAEGSGPRVSLSPSATLVGVYKQVPSGPRRVRAFLGVPYANQTARYQPPTPFSLWQGERMANKFGAICPQNVSILQQQNILPLKLPSDVSEDCLFLNVWAPDTPSLTRLPVIFFIHGGGYTHGFSNLYQGTALASFHDVIFVSINYRLASFGFLCTGSEHAPGNYGLLDTIEALTWVNKYIDKFGGDPGNITVVGESAGAMSVSWLVLSPLSRGLFRRAISQSGSALCPGFVWTPQQAGRYIRKRLADMGFQSTDDPAAMLDFLHSQDAMTLAEQLGEGFRPVIDGHVIPDHPDTLLAQGRFAKDVDYMLGYNSHEGAMFTFAMGPAIDVNDIASTERLVKRLIRLNFRDCNLEALFHEVWRMYFPEGRYQKRKDILSRICDMFGDMVLSSPTDHFAARYAQQAVGRTFLYYFTHRPDFSPYPAGIDADHAMEIFFTIGTVHANIPGIEFSQRDKEFCHFMMQRWVNFAANGDPNGVGLESWPTYNTTSRKSLELCLQPQCHSNLRSRQFQLWQKKVPGMTKGTTSRM